MERAHSTGHSSRMANNALGCGVGKLRSNLSLCKCFQVPRHQFIVVIRACAMVVTDSPVLGQLGRPELRHHVYKASFCDEKNHLCARYVPNRRPPRDRYLPHKITS